MAEFSVREIDADFREIARELDLKIETFRFEFAQDVAEEIITVNPVDTGFMRASWFYSLEPQAPLRPKPSQEGAPIPTQVTLARLAVEGEAIAASSQFFFLNGAEYAVFVETKTNFIRKVADRADVIADRTIERVRRLLDGR